MSSINLLTLSQVEILIQAFEYYRELIMPSWKPGNETITNELAKMRDMIDELKVRKDNMELHRNAYTWINDWGAASLGFAKAVLHRYKDLKSSELRAQREVSRVKGALEAEEAELDQISRLCENPMFNDVIEKELLIDSFEKSNPIQNELVTQRPLVGSLNYFIESTVQANYGTIHGPMTQYAMINEDIDALRKIIVDSQLEQQKIRDLLADLQTFQVQSSKHHPDKPILEKLIVSLSVLADTAQVGQAIVNAAAPHLHALQTWISQLANH